VAGGLTDDCFAAGGAAMTLDAALAQLAAGTVPIAGIETVAITAAGGRILAEDVVVHNSTYASHMFPAWYLGKHFHHKFIQAGHTQGFCENQFGKKVRGIIQREAYRDVFPSIQLGQESKAAGYWNLAGSRGYYLTRGVGQGISGFRGDIQAVDDPYASREDAESPTIRNKVYDWFSADFTTRLLPRAPLYIVATRWHSDDLCGRIEDMQKSGKMRPPYTIINLPAVCEDEENDPLGRQLGEALWPDFYDLDQLLNLKESLPARDWNSLYRGTPVDEEGGVLGADQLQRYDDLPQDQLDEAGNVVKQRIRRRSLSVDCASKKTQRADYTAVTIWYESVDGRHYLAHAAHARVEFNGMVRLIETLAREWNVDEILVEDQGSGMQYIQTRQNEAPAPVIAINTKNDSKEFRFDGVTPMFIGGLVLLPKRAGWLAEFEAEIVGFPNAAHDDYVDSASQYLARARQRRIRGVRKLGGTTSARS
jgi:predicted phage terminase large subunit-like protein